MSKYMTTPPLPVAPQQIVSSTWDISRVAALIHLPAKLSDEAKKAKKKAKKAAVKAVLEDTKKGIHTYATR